MIHIKIQGCCNPIVHWEAEFKKSPFQNLLKLYRKITLTFKNRNWICEWKQYMGKAFGVKSLICTSKSGWCFKLTRNPQREMVWNNSKVWFFGMFQMQFWCKQVHHKQDQLTESRIETILTQTILELLREITRKDAFLWKIYREC